VFGIASGWAADEVAGVSGELNGKPLGKLEVVALLGTDAGGNAN
jgi:hypothetical protein